MTQAPADEAQQHDAVQHSGHAHVQAHVAAEDMAELVGDHPLELLAVQVLQGLCGNAYDHIAWFEACGKGVDACLRQQIDLWRGHSGCQRHFIDNVE